ncbi:MAG TPA: DUF2927 domain-containing protein [Candidatus Limnocylindria bacterium]|nr:DUF2927 domain-containing protein [Candidatus Limnocylindria bacterium]
MRKRLGIMAVVLALFFALGCAASPEPEGLREAFRDAAFRAEYDGGDVDMLRRWERPLAVWIGGDATPEDMEGLREFVAQLNANVPGLPGVSVAQDKWKADVRITLAPLRRLPDVQPGYVPGNWGFFHFTYDDYGAILEGDISVASDVTTQAERDHLIREELTGALGLPNDLDGHPDSIIHAAWTTTRELSELDWALLGLLYDPRLAPGMTWLEAARALGWE